MYTDRKLTRCALSAHGLCARQLTTALVPPQHKGAPMMLLGPILFFAALIGWNGFWIYQLRDKPVTTVTPDGDDDVVAPPHRRNGDELDFLFKG
jgi:hypothetical protein